MDQDARASQSGKRPMPDYEDNPLSRLDQIKANLQDRYATGYPILKELLQNADDSEARRFRLDALPGWPTAANPLLQGPGLLVVNDGKFREEHKKGIRSFGASIKSIDSGAIGKFGFGLASVYHLSDAFVVYSFGDNEPFNTVINPFLNVDVFGNITRNWEPPGDKGLAETDLKLLRDKVTPDFSDRCLALWLPFRREGLRPAPDVGFSSNFPSASKTVAELANADDLRVLLTALRHLNSIDIREHGEIRCAIEVSDARERLLGPKDLQSGVRSFGGTIKTRPDQSVGQFVGREATILDGRLARLRLTPHWPKMISVLSSKPQPEKGEPHGAATLLRAIESSRSQLRISWAVFLPVSENADVDIPIGESGLGQFRMLLHGYFFLDSGRNQIEGLTAPSKDEEPADAAGLRRAWNTELRDSVVLPLLPAVMRDALNSKMVTSAELAQLVSAVAGSSWFQRNRSAICKESALVRALEAPSGIVWRLVQSGNTLRPLPKSVTDAPGRIEELFEDIHSWAEAKGAYLVVDKGAALSAEPMCWTADDLGTLFGGLSSRAFQSRDLARLLGDFLDAAAPGEAERSTIGPHLVSALRKAMMETLVLAPAEQIKIVLNYVPQGLLFPLPASVEHRELFRALASARAGVLPVRREWIGDPLHRPRLSGADLKALLQALQSHVEGDNADQAATAALALLTNSHQPLAVLAQDPDLAALKVLRARDVRTRHHAALSLQALIERSHEGLLFATSPDANKLLPVLAGALPDASPLIVETKTTEFMRESGGALSVQSARKEAYFALINKAKRFGPDDSRAGLLEGLRLDDGDDRAALRRLCSGEHEAGYSSAKLWMLERVPDGLERITTAILNQSENEFFVPARIAEELKSTLRRHLGIEVLDTEGLEALLGKSLVAIAHLKPTAAEQEAFLQTPLSDSLLRRLPIHLRSDGTIGDAEGVFRENEWRVPESLRAHVRIALPCSNKKAHNRLKQLITAWSPQSQIETALAQPQPHLLLSDILHALANILDKAELGSRLAALQKTPWLMAEGKPIPPEDVLALPPDVDEAARTVLLKDGDRPPFMPAHKLAIDIREDAGFAHLKEWVLPDQQRSFETLALMIDDAKIIGRLGSAEDFPIDDLTVLASDGRDLCLPGWSLMATILTTLKDTGDQAEKLVAAFSGLGVENAELAASHLDSLAALADEKGRRGEAARRAYFHGFGGVAKWPEEARRWVFACTRVPTDGGGWRSGREVVQDGDGIDPKHILAKDCASTLRRNDRSAADAPDVGGGVLSNLAVTSRHGREIKTVDLASLDSESAAQQRLFLQAWRNRVPSDLVIIYLGLIGRNAAFKQLSNEWAADATVDVDTLWADLDGHFPIQVLYPGPLSVEVDQRRFLVEQVVGQHVQAIAMSGDLFDAPLGGAINGIIVGNLHKTPEGIRAADGQTRSLVTLPLWDIDLSGYGQREACSIFRQFVEAIALDCLWLGMASQQAALQTMLDKATKVDQAMLEETRSLLRDKLPTILAELKLPTETQSQKMLRKYQEAEERHHRLSGSPAQLETLKVKLWNDISDSESAAELLRAVRCKIGDFGYSGDRVLFELFQNADDAYGQSDDPSGQARFYVESISDGSGGLRVVHWGRPINYLGPNPEGGRRLGYGRDLLNMLLMNFSEKRPSDDLTGKFGLGFKSVHALSDSVGIACGFLSLRTQGGFLPKDWHAGIDEAEELKGSDGKRSTVIDIPFSPETAPIGREAVAAFRTAMSWLPAFARHITRIEFDAESIECERARLRGVERIDVLTLRQGTLKQRALRFDLGGDFSLLLAIGHAAPIAAPKGLRRLWNLAPLEERVGSGWLLNGPFAVDPGRSRIAGSDAYPKEVLRRLGGIFGERLLKLHDLAVSDWSSLARALDLDASESAASQLFWAGLFDIIALDFDDPLAAYLHIDGSGYGRLATDRAVVPTRLPQPFDGLVKAAAVDHFTAGALAEPALFERVRDWPALSQLGGRIVASNIAGQLEKLGFGNTRSIKMSDLLRREIGKEKRVGADLAEKLGSVITPTSIREAPLSGELTDILTTAKEALFLGQDGSWRIAQLPYSTAADDDEERRLCAFAPAKHVLDERYSGSALQFFRVAREQSGFGAQVRDLALWAVEISGQDRDRQEAALRYIIEGRQGRQLGEAVQRDRPKWLPWPTSRLRNSELLSRWTEKEKDDLLYALQGRGAFEPPPVVPPPQPEPETVLLAIHTWWASEGSDLQGSYSRRTYPDSFSPSQLRGASDRMVWFTMFALGCFQSFGRTQDGQHRSFIEAGWREGWWSELANARPPDDVQSWLERLERWSAPEQFDQRYLLWRRTFVDLYAVARWLDEYREIALKLPRIIEDYGVISLNGALQPSYWAPAMRLCIDAAPMNRSLGIGMNWMIREMIRHGVYDLRDEGLMAPYCWAPSQRVRKLLNELGADVGERADKEASRQIYEFIVKHVGEDHARFCGDFDLPLQLITRGTHESAMTQCFAAAHRDPPTFEESDDEFASEMGDQ